MLRCQPEKVYRLAARGELPSYKVEGRRLFDEGEVVRRLESRRVNGARPSSAERVVASIRSYDTAKGERRYEVRYRDGGHRERSQVFSVHKDARAFKLDVERRAQAGVLYQAAPERLGEVAAAWL